MRPPKQKQLPVKKGLCRVLEHVDVDVDTPDSEKGIPLETLHFVEKRFGMCYS